MIVAGNVTSPFEDGEVISTAGLMHMASAEGYAVTLLQVDLRTNQISALAGE